MDSDADVSTPHAAVPDAAVPAATGEDVQRVDAERVDEQPRYRFGKRAGDTGPAGPGMFSFFASSGAGAGMPKPPTLATWICLALAWLFLGSKIPFTVFLGIPLDIAALLLATVCLSRGGVATGVGVLLLGTAGSLVVYLIGLFRFLALG